MRPPTMSPAPDDRPTTPLPSLALALRAPDKPRRAAAASTTPYWPAAGGPTVYRPESSYSVTARSITARSAQPLPPPHRRKTAPPRRWPWVTGGVAVLMVVIALTHSLTSAPPTVTMGDPRTTAPAPTRSNNTPSNAAVPAPSTLAPTPAAVAPALPRAMPPRTAARVVPTPRLVGAAPVTTPRRTPVPMPTTAAQPSEPAPTIDPGAYVAATPPAALPTPLATTPPSSAQSTYYSNCAAARAAGTAPLHRGDPGYRPGLDRDGDGVACE
jgi:hypothetical protein